MLIRNLIGLFIAFVVLSLLFWALQRLWPSIHGQKTIRTGFWTDCLYWLWTPVVTRTITPVVLGLALLPLAAACGWDLKSLV